MDGLERTSRLNVCSFACVAAGRARCTRQWGWRLLPISKRQARGFEGRQSSKPLAVCRQGRPVAGLFILELSQLAILANPLPARERVTPAEAYVANASFDAAWAGRWNPDRNCTGGGRLNACKRRSGSSTPKPRPHSSNSPSAGVNWPSKPTTSNKSSATAGDDRRGPPFQEHRHRTSKRLGASSSAAATPHAGLLDGR